MKLGRPRVESYESPDGSGSLNYIGQDYSHDMGGSDYRFLYKEADGRNVAIIARVQTIPRANAAARASGIDLWSLTFDESEDFKRTYYESHPRDYQVIRFYPETEGSNFDLSEAGRRFCDLFLELNASFKFNDAEYPENGDGHYWERVFFQPYDADPKTHFQHSVGNPQ